MEKIYVGIVLELIALIILVNVAAVQSGVFSQLNNASLCINVNFIKSYTPVNREILCGSLCDENPSCQAFSLADGWCQIFVFNACSKNVKNCSCSRRGQVFVRQQPGLELGALCPSGYGDDTCGVKYKLYNNTGLWQSSRQKCETDSGLVIMADVIDAAEMTQVQALNSKYNGGASLWLGGYQTPGSAEPAGGWYWVGCNTTVASSLWSSGEPNDNVQENTVVIWAPLSKLSDFSEINTEPKGVLCECLSPFG